MEARNHYKGISRKRGMAPAEVATALDAMKDTYKRWCLFKGLEALTGRTHPR